VALGAIVVVIESKKEWILILAVALQLLLLLSIGAEAQQLLLEATVLDDDKEGDVELLLVSFAVASSALFLMHSLHGSQQQRYYRCYYLYLYFRVPRETQRDKARDVSSFAYLLECFHWEWEDRECP